jgi:hypothetical protein
MRTLTGAESKVRSGGNQGRARNKTYFDAVEEEFSTLPWPTPTVRRAHPTNRRYGERDSFENGRVAHAVHIRHSRMVLAEIQPIRTAFLS